MAPDFDHAFAAVLREDSDNFDDLTDNEEHPEVAAKKRRMEALQNTPSDAQISLAELVTSNLWIRQNKFWMMQWRRNFWRLAA